MTLSQYRATRRKFLRDSAAFGGLLSIPGIVAACGGDDSEGAGGKGKIVFWEYKYPGNADGYKYFEDAATRFQDKTGITVDLQFKSAENIEQAVAAAANAKKGFDVLLWWSGPTARNQASLGNVTPLDDKIPQSTWETSQGRDSEIYNGKTYGLPFSVSPWFMVYNQRILAKAGLGEDTFPPANEDPIGWDEFLDICGKIKSDAGAAPLVWANKEGYFNEWWFYNLEAQAYDTTGEVRDVNLGDASYQNPEVVGALNAWKQLYDGGFFFEGGEVIAYEQHPRQFASEQAAMTPYFTLDVLVPAGSQAFGDEAIRYTKIPAHRTDKKLYGAPCLEPDALYAASWSKNEGKVIEWLKFLLSEPELDNVVKATGDAPADDRWNRDLIEDEKVRQIYEGAENGTVYPYDYATQAQYENLLTNGILFLRGKTPAEQLTADWDKVDEEYKQSQES
jgi:ABC-type glycerol-3-phosphate transport system substrate-binding protein